MDTNQQCKSGKNVNKTQQENIHTGNKTIQSRWLKIPTKKKDTPTTDINTYKIT